MHANYEALKSVLAFFRKNKVSRFICCGDLVGYGPQPSECVREVMALPELTAVLGNHDAAVTGKMELRWFNHNAVAAIEFAKKNLSEDELSYLAALPECLRTEDFTLVHGSPRKPLTEYLLSEHQFSRNLPYWVTSPCFIGHTHVPGYFRQSADSEPEADALRPAFKVMLDGVRYMLNPGSVGQPRDGDPRASCGLYDPKKKTFEIFRVDYDFPRTQALMKEGELPPMLIERLAFGL